jgi:hypothetical protein
MCPRENVEARIQKLRDRAEEIRTDAAKIRQERIRASMLSIVPRRKAQLRVPARSCSNVVMAASGRSIAPVESCAS